MATADVAAGREQLDEVELMEAMVGREGEFEWRQDDSGRVSGRLQVYVHLEQGITVTLARREKKAERNAKDSTIPNTASSSSTSKPSSSLAHHHPSIPPPSPSPPHPPPSHPPHAMKLVARINIVHLPPILLDFDLPPTYPAVDKPNFTISCKWLNFTELSLLCHELDSIWRSDEGSVVLYNWQQFLASETLPTLNVTSELCLHFEDPSKLDDRWDKRAVQDMEHLSLMLPLLMEYDLTERQREFAEKYFDCEICFLTLPGTKCKRLDPCGHIHCQDCLTLHVTTKVESGDVARISCPGSSCDELLPVSTIQDLVSKPIFERLDKLLLQRTLDGMNDVVYCPRPSCRCVTLKEEDSDMAQCPRCRFSFCILCRHAWHGVSPCKLLPGDLKELRETWETLDEVERKEMEVRYGKNKLQTAFQEYDSYNWIQSNARQCPSCNSKIQKSLGCNKMTCTVCLSNFCWLCDAPLPKVDPYKHFRVGQSSCAGKLFEGIVLDGWEDDFW